MRTYAYFRVDGLTTNEIDFLQLLSNFGYEVQENRLVFEQVNIDVSLIYRSNFINLINYTLESKDVLIINGIDSLGSNFKEIYSSVNYIFKKDINLICLEFSKKKITGDLKKIFFHFLKICADFEGRVSSGCAKERKKVNKIGRPEVLNKTQQEEILKKFKNGQSIYSLAKQYSVARTVIQRLLRKSENTTIRDNFWMYLKNKCNRFLIAYNVDNFNKKIIVQFSYFLEVGIFDKKNLLELKSIDGASCFEIVLIQYKKKKILFIKENSCYCADLNISLFDMIK